MRLLPFLSRSRAKARHDAPAAAGMLLVIAPGPALLGRCRLAAEFLACRRARTASDDPGGRVLGIWLDASGVDAAPSTSPEAGGLSPATFRVRESVGIGGLWTLQSLETTAGTARDAGEMRELLVRSLAFGPRSRTGGAAPQFVPVFDPTVETPEDVGRQCERLRRMFPRLVTEPLAWTVASGEIAATVAPGDGRPGCDAAPSGLTPRPSRWWALPEVPPLNWGGSGGRS